MNIELNAENDLSKRVVLGKASREDVSIHQLLGDLNGKKAGGLPFSDIIKANTEAGMFRV